MVGWAGWPVGRVRRAYMVREVEAERDHRTSQAAASPPHPIDPHRPRQIDEKAVQTPFAEGRAVTLTFPAASAPERVVFVLKELSPEKWINNGSQFLAQLKPPELGHLLEKVLSIEGGSDHWSLLNRFNLAVELLEPMDAAGGWWWGFGGVFEGRSGVGSMHGKC